MRKIFNLFVTPIPRPGAPFVSAARKTRGQAVVEMALGSLLLAMLLAAAIDMGRAYYTSVVVMNMASEGALYAATFPDRDSRFPGAGVCSQLAVVANSNIQDRARTIARAQGLVIKQPSQSNIQIQPATCSSRCDSFPITVTVSYRMDDLFLPGIVGMKVLTITKSSSMRMTRSAYTASSCPDP